MPSAKTKRACAKRWYASKKKEVCTARRDYYAANADKCKEASKLAYENKSDAYKKAYRNDPEKFKEASKKAYENDPERFKDASRKAYANDPDRFKKASKNSYNANREKKKVASKNVIMQILKQKGKLRKRHTKKIQKTIKKPLNTITMSAEKKYVVRKGKNIHCVNPMKHVLSCMLKAFVNLCIILK